MQQKLTKQLPSQVKLYNRHFYLRNAEHELLQQQYQTQIKQLSNIPKITPSSYAILSKKLQATIYTAINSVIGRNESFSFNEMQAIIKYFQNTLPEEETFHCQLWLLINCYSIQPGAQRDVFIAVLRILMDPYNLSVQQMKKLIIQIPSLTEIDQQRQAFVLQHPQLQQQTLKVNKLLTEWNNYKYSNNTKFQKSKQQYKKLLKQQSSRLTFKPNISKRSQIIASKQTSKYLQKNKTIFNNIKANKSSNQLQKYFSHEQNIKENSGIEKMNQKNNGVDHHQLLFHRKLEKDLYFKTFQPVDYQKNRSPINSRVAKPQQITQIVNNLYYKKPKKQDVDQKLKEEKQQLKKCTFRPQINRDNSARSISPSPAVRNYSKEVQRIHRGREQLKRKKAVYENLGRVKKPAQCYKAPSFIERDTPKLILQVKIDESRIQKICLKGDEDAKIVAKKFVLKHNLSQSMQSVLEELVEEQLSCL